MNFLKSTILACALIPVLVACGDDGPAATADAGTDAMVGPPMMASACERYCTEITATCTGANSQYSGMTDCMDTCAQLNWPDGTKDEMVNNTVECRIYHTGVASADQGLHCPHAGSSGGGVCGAALTFRTEESTDAAYVRVDRAGMPAVSTALATDKNAYNDGNPADDVAATFAGELLGNLQAIHDALDEDLIAKGFAPCGGGPQCAGQLLGPNTPVSSLILPDALSINPAGEASFPNGRKLEDRAMDITLAVILLDVVNGSCGTPAADCTPATFASLPLNPGANDVDFLTAFPYLAPPTAP